MNKSPKRETAPVLAAKPPCRDARKPGDDENVKPFGKFRKAHEYSSAPCPLANPGPGGSCQKHRGTGFAGPPVLPRQGKEKRRAVRAACSLGGRARLLDPEPHGVPGAAEY